MKRIRHITDTERSPYLDAALGSTCAFISGGINAGGFIIIGRYTSHVTGIISESAGFIVTHNWSDALQVLGLIFGFFCGATLASYTIHVARYWQFKNPFALAIMSSGIILIFLGLWAMHYGTNYPYDWCLEFGLFIAMGIQNATVTQLTNNDVRATHMTGVLTDLGIETGKHLFSSPDKSTTKLRLGSLILLSFIIGGIIGIGLFQSAVGIRSLFIYGSILLALSILPIIIKKEPQNHG
jgi:uncharacterized membrane protein YoaK (UPF0700 family)